MREYFKKALRRLPLLAATLSAAALIVAMPSVSAAGVKKGLLICASSAVPSLYPFCVLSAFFVRSGLCGYLGKILEKPVRVLFALPGSAGAAPRRHPGRWQPPPRAPSWSRAAASGLWPAPWGPGLFRSQSPAVSDLFGFRAPKSWASFHESPLPFFFTRQWGPWRFVPRPESPRGFFLECPIEGQFAASPALRVLPFKSSQVKHGMPS